MRSLRASCLMSPQSACPVTSADPATRDASRSSLWSTARVTSVDDALLHQLQR